MSLLSTKELIKSYQSRRVVDRVNMVVEPGEVVGLLGPNGAGKTTTFYMIAGIIRPDSGRVFFDGIDISGLNMYHRAKLGIGYLPQQPSIFKKLTVEENILIILESLKLSKKEKGERLKSLMDYLHLGHLAKHEAWSLSGGERRRLEITRLLVTSPKIILLDEPFLGVDPISVLDVQKIILKLKKSGLGILLTDHNVRETLSITDRTYLLFDGQVMKEGDSAFLSNDPEAKRFYLGENFRL
ncbi:MAG: LPS export ABC transporter ATP-binding protein [Candidatus Aureabacteria bacterium]|nr:LPS export ABC transporter ATP-binding protein [Candidatus Auribacterota bacterium]